MTTSKEKIKNQIQFIKMLADAIKEAKRIPSGHLYAMVLGVCTLEVYQSCIDILKNTKLIEENNFELIWKG